MEVAGLKVAWEQLRNALAVIYSIIVIATIIPGFTPVSTLIILPYFVLVPGYFATLLLRHTASFLEKLFYSIAWSVAILVSVYSIRSILPDSPFLPINLIVPALTILLLAYDHFHRPLRAEE